MAIQDNPDLPLSFSITAGEAEGGCEEICEDWTARIQRCIHMHLQCIEYQFSDTMCLFLCMLIGSEIYLLFTSLYFTCCSYKAERSRYWPAQLVLPGTL